MWNKYSRWIKTWFFIIPGFIAFQGFGKNQPDSGSTRVKYHVLPSAYYLPETGIAGGGLLYAVVGDPTDSLRKKGNLQHFISFTQKGQILLENSWFLFTPSNRHLISGSLDVLRFPEIFFGIGINPTKVCPPFLYQANQFRFTNYFYWATKKEVYLGCIVRSEALGKPETKSTMYSDKLAYHIGGKGFLTGGLGPAFLWDKRDFALNPTRGIYLDIHSASFLNLGQKPFSLFMLDFRTYFSNPSKSGTFALQAVYQRASAQTPFRMLPGLGGPGMMRGFFIGRYRDNQLWVLQSEWRQKIKGRFGATVFSGIGSVAKTGPELTDRVFKHLGVGLRWQIKKDEKVNLRLDFARAGKDVNVYIVLAEAF